MLFFSIWGFFTLKRYEKLGYISIDHNIESFGADILVLHNVYTCQFKQDSRSKLKKAKQFLNPIFSFRIFREWISVNLGRCSTLISVSEDALKEARLLNKKNKRSIVVENGVDDERFKPLPLHEKENIRSQLNAKDKFVILFVGHEFVRKRLDLSISALSELSEDYELWVIGGRFDNVSFFKSLCKEKNVENRVKFIGSTNEPEKYMSAADCFILVSDYETWGMVVIESLASGTPVIMTDIGCAQAVIKDSKNGYIVESNEHAIANAIKKVQVDLTNFDMEVNCRDSIQKFKWDSVTQKYVNEILVICKDERKS
jgi:glycosyltransferase involved in cell wall biosynthesis